MQPSYYLLLIALFLILYSLYRNRQAVAAQKAIRKRTSEEKKHMIELAKRFIGKDCLIYAFDGNHQYQGIIREVSEGAVLVENGGTLEAINLDFVIRIREYPRDKKGKKKSVILD